MKKTTIIGVLFTILLSLIFTSGCDFTNLIGATRTEEGGEDDGLISVSTTELYTSVYNPIEQANQYSLDNMCLLDSNVTLNLSNVTKNEDAEYAYNESISYNHTTNNIYYTFNNNLTSDTINLFSTDNWLCWEINSNGKVERTKRCIDSERLDANLVLNDLEANVQNGIDLTFFASSIDFEDSLSEYIKETYEKENNLNLPIVDNEDIVIECFKKDYQNDSIGYIIKAKCQHNLDGQKYYSNYKMELIISNNQLVEFKEKLDSKFVNRETDITIIYDVSDSLSISTNLNDYKLDEVNVALGAVSLVCNIDNYKAFSSETLIDEITISNNISVNSYVYIKISSQNNSLASIYPTSNDNGWLQVQYDSTLTKIHSATETENYIVLGYKEVPSGSHDWDIPINIYFDACSTYSNGQLNEANIDDFYADLKIEVTAIQTVDEDETIMNLEDGYTNVAEGYFN